MVHLTKFGTNLGVILEINYMLFLSCKRMKQTLRYIGLLAILPLVMVALSPDLISDVDAAKAEGSEGTQSPKSYGSATDKIVCGDHLCGVENGNIGRAK